MKIRYVVFELLCVERQTNRQADMANIMGAFWNSIGDGPKLYERLAFYVIRTNKVHTFTLMF